MEFFNCNATFPNFNERELHHKCFPINFAKFFWTAISTLKWLGSVCVGGREVNLPNIIISHNILENFIEIPEVVRSQEEFLCQY